MLISTREQSKSPLHPSAIRIKDATIGSRVVVFNRREGIIDDLVILSRPRVFVSEDLGLPLKPWRTLVVTVRNDCGQITQKFLDDMGIIPYFVSGGIARWNNLNFSVKKSKEHLLPSANPLVYIPEEHDPFQAEGVSDPWALLDDMFEMDEEDY